MKIREFTIFTGKTRLVVDSSSISLENAQIQGNIQYERLRSNQEKEKCSFITIKISGRITDKDSLRELKGLINQTDF